jgi:hypothetical protein
MIDMKMKEFAVLFVIILLIVGSLVVFKMKRGNQTAPLPIQESAQLSPTNVSDTTAVNASNNSFSPANFSAVHLDTLVLSVTAVDHDYSFAIPDYPRLDTVIPKGTTKQIVIGGLGVGEYTYTCGTGCTGKLSIVQSSDTEE